MNIRTNILMYFFPIRFRIVNSIKIMYVYRIIILIIIFGLLATAGYQKYSVNTAIWPPGVHWTSYEEVRGFNYIIKII